MLQPGSLRKGLMVSAMDAREEYGGTWATFSQSKIVLAVLGVKGV